MAVHNPPTAIPDMAGKVSNAKAPEQTFEEVKFLKRLIEEQKTVRVRHSPFACLSLENERCAAIRAAMVGRPVSSF